MLHADKNWVVAIAIFHALRGDDSLLRKLEATTPTSTELAIAEFTRIQEDLLGKEDA